MGRFRKMSLFMLSFMMLTANPKAATCGYEEQAKLNNEAANVKANYEIKERILEPGEYDIPDGIEDGDYVAKTDYIQVNILNLTENMYAEATNDVNRDVQKFNYSDTQNGNISFNWNELDTMATYTIKIYASDKTSCERSPLKTLYVSLPRYNDYSTYEICKQVPDYYLCQRYVTYDSVGYDTFFTRVQEQIDKKNKEEEENRQNNKWYKKVANFIVEHKVPFIIGGVTLVVVASGATIIIIKKRRRSII